MSQPTQPAEAEISQLAVRPETVFTGSNMFNQTRNTDHLESLVALRVDDDCSSEAPPARSSFDSLLLLPEPTAPSSVQTSPHMRPREVYYRLSTQNPWFLEIFNAVLLLVAISAIVATLYIHDGRPLPQWPFNITINAMLSIYAVVLKSSMALIQTSCIGQMQWSWFSTSSRPLHDLVSFHDAGQGPWGSVSWIWTHRLRQPIATLGAFIIIWAIAVDPSVQQLIQPVDCTEELPGAPAASIPTTNVLAYQEFTEALQASIVAGMYTRQNLTDFECITGNCTFAGNYTTLGFCSSCEDVSAKVIITKNCKVISTQNRKIYEGPCDQIPEGPEGKTFTTIWNITTAYLPWNLTFYYNSTIWEQLADPYASLEEDDHPDVFKIEASPHRVPDLLGGNVYGSSEQIDFGIDLGVIYGMSKGSIHRSDPTYPRQNLTGCEDAFSNNTWYCRGYGAATCLFQPCLRTYSAGIQAGRLTETLVKHTDLGEDWGYSKVTGAEITIGYFGLVDKDCVSDDQHQQLAAAGYDGVRDAQSRWLPYKVTYDPTLPNAVEYNATLSYSLLASHCLFLVADNWVRSMNGFPLGTVQRLSADYDPLSTRGSGRPLFLASDTLLYIWNSGRANMTGVSEIMDNLAEALTLWGRSTRGRTWGQDGLGVFNRRVTGQVLHYATCVQVTWAWLALPAGLTVLTVLLLAATMVTTTRGQLPVWKSSPLTMLFHGPGGRYWIDPLLFATDTSKKPDGEDAITRRGMEKYAAMVSVKLGDNGGRGELRLRQVSAVSQKSI